MNEANKGQPKEQPEVTDGPTGQLAEATERLDVVIDAVQAAAETRVDSDEIKKANWIIKRLNYRLREAVIMRNIAQDDLMMLRADMALMKDEGGEPNG